jgi:hypothetical protein
MKKWILLFTFCWIGTLGIGQIDSSAWEGKVVLVMIQDLYNTNSSQIFFNERKKDFRAEWYLTDSSHLIVDTLSSRNLDNFGIDTVVIIFKMDWYKYYTQKNCLPDGPYGCLIWGIAPIFEFKNFQTQKWEKFIMIKYDVKPTYIQKFQEQITETYQKLSYEGKKTIIKNQHWSKELEELVKERFKDFEVITGFEVQNELYPKDDAIYIYQRPNSNIIEMIDLETHRVIEKIKIPVSKE